MNDLAPGPSGPRSNAGGGRRSSARQAIYLAGCVLVMLGVGRLVARGFTDRALAETLTVRALGATLAVTGFLVVIAARQGPVGARRLAGSFLGSVITGAGLAKLVWPSGSLPWTGQLGFPGDALVLLFVGAITCALSPPKIAGV